MPIPAIHVEGAGHTVRVSNPDQVSLPARGGGAWEPDFCETVPQKRPDRLEGEPSRARKEQS